MLMTAAGEGMKWEKMKCKNSILSIFIENEKEYFFSSISWFHWLPFLVHAVALCSKREWVMLRQRSWTNSREKEENTRSWHQQSHCCCWHRLIAGIGNLAPVRANWYQGSGHSVGRRQDLFAGLKMEEQRIAVMQQRYIFFCRVAAKSSGCQFTSRLVRNSFSDNFRWHKNSDSRHLLIPAPLHLLPSRSPRLSGQTAAPAAESCRSHPQTRQTWRGKVRGCWRVLRYFHLLPAVVSRSESRGSDFQETQTSFFLSFWWWLLRFSITWTGSYLFHNSNMISRELFMLCFMFCCSSSSFHYTSRLAFRLLCIPFINQTRENGRKLMRQVFSWTNDYHDR